jgi:hypothetical protein
MEKREKVELLLWKFHMLSNTTGLCAQLTCQPGEEKRNRMFLGDIFNSFTVVGEQVPLSPGKHCPKEGNRCCIFET